MDECKTVQWFNGYAKGNSLLSFYEQIYHLRSMELSEGSTDVFAAAQRKLQDERSMGSMGIITHRGYPAETHKVVTKDGYILTLHRIPHGRNGRKGRGPVLLQHGLVSSSFDYLSLEPSQSLSYSLADAGYDVWLGNNRGNIYSNEHVDDNNDNYWNFSWHEMGEYDFPAMIDYILEVTQRPNLFLVGHSQGSHAFIIATNHYPEIQRKVKHHFAMAPSLSSFHLRSFIIRLAAVQPQLITIALSVIPDQAYSVPVFQPVCGQSSWLSWCKWILKEFSGSMDQIDEEHLPLLTANFPGGTSNKNWMHYLQKLKSGTKYFDHGTKGNLEAYGTKYPRDYDFSQYSVPTSLFFSPSDKLVSTEDMKIALKILPSTSIVRVRNLTGFGHFEFMWGNRAKAEIYDEIIGHIKSLSKPNIFYV